ncbi:MAG: calcium-binding protein, partial [Herbaspirillum sp.]|nr:calcium-binding protein [Herbaspirillum sp.]
PDLLMVEANLNGIGNALDNHLTGNDQNNILDGMGGADIMAGGKGDDSYYVDNAGDQVIEKAGEGVDTVYAKVSTSLSANVENLVLLDAGKPQSAVINGVDLLVYGYPGSYQLNYNQGNAVAGYKGTCGETSVANVTMLGDKPVTEKEVVERAIKEGLCDTDSKFPGARGATTQWDQHQLLEEFGFSSTVADGFNAQKVARDIKEGKGVTVSVYADALWDGSVVPGRAFSNHRITVTGVACSASTGDIAGFYIADSGRGRASDMCRFVTTEQMKRVASARGANTITTDAPIKMLQQDINATGNELDNTLVGNRGDNVITGGRGNDLLIGGAGNDTYVMGRGDGQDVVYDHDATKANIDILKFSDARQTNLWFSHVGNDLRIDVMGTKDQVTVKDWYVGGTSGTDNHIERIKTADGKTLYDNDVEKLVQAMASFAPPSATQTSWKEGQTSQGKVLLSITH